METEPCWCGKAPREPIPEIWPDPKQKPMFVIYCPPHLAVFDYSPEKCIEAWNLAVLYKEEVARSLLECKTPTEETPVGALQVESWSLKALR